MKEIDGSIKAQEQQLKNVINNYCNALGCEQCPYDKNCLAVTLENSINQKQQ